MNGVSDHEGLTHMHLVEKVYTQLLIDIEVILLNTHTHLGNRQTEFSDVDLHHMEVCAQMHTHKGMHALRTCTDVNNTDTWLVLKHCCVCIPLPLSTHPPQSRKSTIKPRKNKNTKRLKGGNRQLPSFFHPTVPPKLTPFLHLPVPNVCLPPVKREGCGQTG